MKRGLTLVLSDEEMLELCRVLMDRDEAGALVFVDRHLKRQVNQLLDGG